MLPREKYRFKLGDTMINSKSYFSRQFINIILRYVFSDKHFICDRILVGHIICSVNIYWRDWEAFVWITPITRSPFRRKTSPRMVTTSRRLPIQFYDDILVAHGLGRNAKTTPVSSEVRLSPILGLASA